MCERVEMPGGGVAIVCGGRRRRRTPCAYCPRPHEILCDGPTAGGVTCDRRCCRAHAKHVGPDRDLCRECAVDQAKQRGLFA